ncbi:cytochrome c oxidase assembly protein [Polymorphospora rubra]|uniref:cytochrome c oxidase assembly protein n=1 Tax=Polymorphospora rubra TaxID=338584 RepID=UPI0033CD76E2
MPVTGADPGTAAVTGGLLSTVVVSLVCLALAGYGRGVHELWSRHGVGAIVPIWRVAAFTTGALIVLAVEGGLLDDLAHGSLAGHMTQHMVLLLVAGPLLAAGGAGLPLSLATPLRPRRRLARWRAAPTVRWLRRPVVYASLAGAAQLLVLWVWHLPVPYVAALDHPVLHGVEHLCFVVAAWLLWTPVVGAPRHRPPAPVGALLLVTTMLPATALGAVLTFAPRPVYPAAVYGSDPLADQQLAGLLMWLPMDAVLLVAALAGLLRWLARPDGDPPVPADDPAVTAGTPTEGAVR